MSNFHDAYNACLSITILPTEIVRLTNVAAPYVYKVFFQIIFGLCPVIVYALSRRCWSRFISILAAIYFASFPTFINDMPFLNRQEVGMLFAGVAILAITSTLWRRRDRLIVMFGAAIGLDLSHYSTMYIFVATVLMAWIASLVLRIFRLRWPASQQRLRDNAPTTALTLLRIGPVMALVAILVLWQGVITQTAGNVVADAHATFWHSFIQVEYGQTPSSTTSSAGRRKNPRLFSPTIASRLSHIQGVTQVCMCRHPSLPATQHLSLHQQFLPDKHRTRAIRHWYSRHHTEHSHPPGSGEGGAAVCPHRDDRYLCDTQTPTTRRI